MTYATFENSAQRGTPVELYEFTQGLARWFYISGANELLRLGHTYIPSSVRRDRLKQSTDVFKNGIRLSFPRTNEFASQFLGFPPEELTTVTILRGHWGDPDSEFQVYWKGRITAAKVSGSDIELECEPIYSSLRRPGLRAKFELSCRHVLYGRGCGLNRELFRHNGTILGVTSGLAVEVSGVSGIFPDGHFTGGLFEVPSTGHARFIVNHVGGVVTLSRPMQDLTGTLAVALFPGCDHTKATCLAKFNNLDNFGGFPWIPKTNPFGGSSIV
jgi:uncharacterized phage protein (TIGR02218 family)